MLSIGFTSDSCVCVSCIGDPVLRDRAAEDGWTGECELCMAENVCVVDASTIAEWVERIFYQDYIPGDAMRGDDGWHQDGRAPEDLVSELTGIEETMFTLAVVQAFSRDEDIDDSVDATSNYVELDPQGEGHHALWDDFCDRIKSRGRFMDGELKAHLAAILGEDEAAVAREALLTVLDFQRGSNVYRARLVNDLQDAKKLLGDAPTELGSPRSPSAGRMNPHGIRVFYGADSIDVCVGEVRPPVGGYLIAGAFEALRPLRLLDLCVTRRARGSRFDEDSDRRRDKAAFLASFSAIISRPILSHEAALEYLPTQAVAEYVGAVLGLDGVIYPSSQVARSFDPDKERDLGRNIALFGDAALVEASSPAPKNPGLRYVPESGHPRLIRGIEVTHHEVSFSRFVTIAPLRR